MTADEVFGLATWIGVLALAVGVVCAAVIALSGKVRDDNLKVALAQANARTAEAELRLEYLRQQQMPRRLVSDTFKKALGDAPKATVETLFDENIPDASPLALSVNASLRAIGWDTALPARIPDDPPPPPEIAKAIPALPKHFLLGMQAWGIAVVTRPEDKDLAGSRDALVSAIGKSVVPGDQISFGTNEYVPARTIRVLIGPRP